MIKRFYSKRKSKPGWKWDAKKKQWWSWGFDEWIDGKRKRESGFSSEDEVKVVVGKLKERDVLVKHGLITLASDPLVTVQQLVEARAQAFDFNSPQHRHRYGVITSFRDVISPLKQVRQLTTDDLDVYVRVRQASPGLKAATIQRELNEICAMFHASKDYFPVLARWTPPRLPKLKPENRRRPVGREPKVPRERLQEVRERYNAVLAMAQAAREILDAGEPEKKVRERFSELPAHVMDSLIASETPSNVAVADVAEHYEVSEDTIRGYLYRRVCKNSDV